MKYTLRITAFEEDVITASDPDFEEISETD